MFTYKYRYILKAWIFFFLRDVDPTFPRTPPGPQFLWKFGPDFRDTGPEIEPRFPAKPLRRKSVPKFGPRVGGIEPATFRLQACVPPTKFGWPARPYIFICYMAITPGPGPTEAKIQNPNSKRAVWILDFGVWSLDFGFWSLDFGFWILDFGVWILDFGFWILDFGFWILDFGFWILDFGFWILDQFSLRSFCGGPKRPRLDFGFWILDLGFWILDFGCWILDFGFWAWIRITSHRLDPA